MKIINYIVQDRKIHQIKLYPSKFILPLIVAVGEEEQKSKMTGTDQEDTVVEAAEVVLLKIKLMLLVDSCKYSIRHCKLLSLGSNKIGLVMCLLNNCLPP